MNHCVPDFEIAEEDAIPCSSGYFFPQKSSMPNENIAELIWRNGKLIMQSKSQRSPKKSSLPSMNISTGDPVLPTSMDTTDGAGCSTTPQIESSHVCTENHLFMEEDEMATWLHYPIEDLCTDECTQVSSGCFPESSTKAEQSDSKRLATNFMDSSRMKAKGEEFHPNLCDTRELIHVGSSEPSLGLVTSRELPESVISSEIGAAQLNTMPIKGLKDVAPSEPTISSSSGGSDGSAERSLLPATSYLKRKRTGDIEDSDCPGEDAGLEFMGTKKAPRQSTSTRRARAAEVHNLSERKRRDRINEKMRTLQELIPHCNKLDKASVLDEAIEYLKSLQLQVQMMSMGCNMSPIMYPSIQQYMTPMGMGMDMMAAGIRPMMQFNPFLAGSAMASPNLTQFGPRFPIQGFHIPRAPPQDHTRVQSTSQSEQALNISTLQGTMPIQPSSIIDSYQQYLDFNQLQQPHQNQPPAQEPRDK